MTPGQPNDSPLSKKGDYVINDGKGVLDKQGQLVTTTNKKLNTKLDAFASTVENMVLQKVKALVHNFWTLQNELLELKEDYSESLNHENKTFEVKLMAPCSMLSEVNSTHIKTFESMAWKNLRRGKSSFW